VFVIANGLRVNSSLKSLETRFDANNREHLAIARALQENKGLADLNLSDGLMSDETWGALCDSLKAHPTLKVLNLQYTTHTDAEPSAAAAKLKSRTQSLLEMMKVNMSIHTIHLDICYYSKQDLFQRSVIPYLETNRFRPRVRAIQKTRPIPYRVKVLGRALLAVQTDPNRFWMLLSGNAEVAFPSTTAKTTPAARLPTPATAAAPVNVAPAAASRTCSTTDTSAAGNVATSTACQKRKARP
jgi:hypothetical protein